jgi:hypothetical protein
MSNDASLSPDEFRAAADGISAIAIANFEMGTDEGGARNAVLEMWNRLGRPPGLFCAAVESTTRSPQPLLETAVETDRARRIREMLGLRSSEESLVAMLAARELLEQLASEFEGADSVD